MKGNDDENHRSRSFRLIALPALGKAKQAFLLNLEMQTL
jgi:hypothetical protein